MTSAARRIVGAIVLPLIAIGLLCTVAAPDRTDAAFTDVERAASPQMSALRLVSPQIVAITACRRPVLGLNNVLVVQWRMPTFPTGPALTAANAGWHIGGSARVQGVVTGPVNGVYTTSFHGDLLGDLLGGLLGTSYSVSARTYWETPGETDWVSSEPTRIEVDVPLLLGSPTCTFTNGK